MCKNKPYKESIISITTKHAKALAVAPPFKKWLEATVVEYAADTDQLGTFSGELERTLSPVECAKTKCSWSQHELSMASEGSFGPHPAAGFAICNHEILYFADKKRGFDLMLSSISPNTNFASHITESLDDAKQFAEKALFPSHAIIIRPNKPTKPGTIFKGITSWEAFLEAFTSSQKESEDGKVFLQTDMRANFNPLRMQHIGELAEKLAKRLASACVQCQQPGWGIKKWQPGLECSLCKQETDLIRYEIYGCTLCPYEEIIDLSLHGKLADPAYCHYCNP